ncbi:HAD family hydrolase [Bdellovibrio sp. HCB185ZH]|uniref:HAD family hydrolase n=1 Tax=Bdellovibrio sp. HCB185ZH TaxID=3394235 RepID=UPI0039A4E134
MIDQILVNIHSLVSEGKKCLVVFDLDSTLFDVSPRIEKILMDFALDPENIKRFPEQVSCFSKIKTAHTDWGFTNALQRAGLDGHHPEFQEAVALYWRKHFFSNDYLKYDTPNEGALEYVHEVMKAGADVAYLTGRDVHRMEPGTTRQLQQWNLPLNDKAVLFVKPDKAMDDAEYKTDWFLAKERQGYDKVYFFDNEPVILNLMGAKCPHVESIFFDSTHSGKAEPPPDLPRIMNFVLNQRNS